MAKKKAALGSRSGERFVIAAANSKFDEMQKLLDRGVDINHRGASGGTALHTAAYYGLGRSVDFLIQAGADLESRDINNETPLMRACWCGKAKGSRVAMKLIAAGADVTSMAKVSWRPGSWSTLMIAAGHHCTPEVLQALIDGGADVNGPRGAIQTPLMLAARADDVAALRVLVHNGADLTRMCKLRWAGGRTAEGLAEFDKRKKALAYLRAVRLGQMAR